MSFVPPGGLVLVTGANGYIASVTVKTLLEAGYSVRGTVRSISKHRPLLDYFGPKFSLVEVPEIAADNAFGKAVLGVDGIAHVAANTQFGAGLALISQNVKSFINILEAAAKEPQIKRVVITSAQGACASCQPGIPYEINQSTWNKKSIEAANTPFDGKDPLKYSLAVFSAAKTLAEQSAFDWVREHKPHFFLNSVVPAVNIGKVPAIEHLGFGSSGALIDSIVRGSAIGATIIPSQWFVNTEDTALLHLAALTLEEVQNERILAFSAPYSWMQMIEILHRRFPERNATMLQSVDEPETDRGVVDNTRSVELLNRMGRPGFRNLEETLVAGMESVLEAESLPVRPWSRLDQYLQ
ncbi:unnamed protein product [Clonostachys solani]|uniref:NAD-dependent epimerase/dehydratase domain-containing protein n=1 Tax=Clonostachys solani TaxID=160281 RepID=A0A9N9YYG4_9HYPO|nr:unnamed protein product [Clonostachys solani]